MRWRCFGSSRVRGCKTAIPFNNALISELHTTWAKLVESMLFPLHLIHWDDVESVWKTELIGFLKRHQCNGILAFFFIQLLTKIKWYDKCFVWFHIEFTLVDNSNTCKSKLDVVWCWLLFHWVESYGKCFGWFHIEFTLVDNSNTFKSKLDVVWCWLLLHWVVRHKGSMQPFLSQYQIISG